ncbi:MAG: hypothetical protein B6V02_03160 [Thermoprotei archaeon ex4572_64]|nr:MAG: hypothetical protein B6V02_03160 [Thermoprotei archaeon ex4572_64]
MLAKAILSEILRRLKKIELEKLIYLTLLVDKIGMFNIFDWYVDSGLIASTQFVNTLEEMIREESVKIVNGIVVLVRSVNVECGWLCSKISGTVNYVLNTYGNYDIRILRELAYTYLTQHL